MRMFIEETFPKQDHDLLSFEALENMKQSASGMGIYSTANNNISG